MATCKECIHYEPCFEYGNILDPVHGGVTCDSFKSAADMVEVQHGEWIEFQHIDRNGNYYNSHYKCSKCDFDDCYEEYSYCPNCGAKMKED